MGKKETDRSAGFGAIGVVLIVVAVALVGLIAWRVYDASKTKSGSSTSQGSSNSQSSAGSTVTTQPTPQPTVTYLDFKELGVKIKLSDDIKDATYYYDTSGSAPVVRVSTSSLVSKSGGTCDPKTANPFGSLTKSQTLTLPDGATLSVNGTNVFQFGSSYIIYTTPNQPCTSDTTTSSLETAQLASFKEALKTMQADQ